MTNTPDHTHVLGRDGFCKTAGCLVMPKATPDQVDALDEILMQFNWDVGGVNNPTNSLRKAKAKLSALLVEAKKQGGLNALTQLKFDRIDHTLSTPSAEWTREVDFIDEHIKELEKQRESTE